METVFLPNKQSVRLITNHAGARVAQHTFTP
jgi:hypothetical protein